VGGMRGGAVLLPLKTLRSSFDFYGFLPASRSGRGTQCQIAPMMGGLLLRGFFLGLCARSRSAVGGGLDGRMARYE
jgi:hypothetical protein